MHAIKHLQCTDVGSLRFGALLLIIASSLSMPLYQERLMVIYYSSEAFVEAGTPNRGMGIYRVTLESSEHLINVLIMEGYLRCWLLWQGFKRRLCFGSLMLT